MMVLPSGRVIGLSAARSKYHALRKPGVGPESAHRKLYTLVDILYRYHDEAGNPKRGWTEYDYEFSGYTLDSVRAAPDWSEYDKTALFAWLQEKEQVQLIETARRRLVNEQQSYSSKLYSSPHYLYSLLHQRLASSSLQGASAAQWLATIKNFRQKGIREEEIHWSGLPRYLQALPQQQRINKACLLEKFNRKNLQLELSIEQVWGTNGGLGFTEVAQRMPHQAVYRAALKLDDHCLCVLRYVDQGCNYRVGVIKTLTADHEMALNKYWFVLDPYGRAVVNTTEQIKNDNRHLFFTNSTDAKFAANKHAREHFGMRSGANIHTHFDHLTLFGGYDYREWIVSLPEHQRIFFGAHFFDHNILVHIRTTTRTDKAGRKILFIEEVQSDWHQSGQRLGYNNNAWGKVANAPFKQEWPVLAIKLMLIHASQNGFAGIAWPKGEVQEKRYRRDLPGIKFYYDRLIPKAVNSLVKRFHCGTENIYIQTRDPWLSLEKQQDKWCVADGEGKFKTRAKYHCRNEAMAVIARHCREIELQVHAVFINQTLRQQIEEQGLPLFGHTLK